MQSRLYADAVFSNMSTQVGNYRTDKVQNIIENCNPTSENHQSGYCRVKHSKNYVDVESDLKGLKNVITKRDPPVYNDYGLQGNDRGPMDPVKTFKANEMQLMNEGISTRSKRPCNVLSGVSIDRFENLGYDPQQLDNIVMNEPHRGGIHTRNNEKDACKQKCAYISK